MNPLEFLGKLGRFGPLFFGVGFIAPLVGQSMDAMSMAAPLGLTTIQLGLIVGTSMGLVASARESWL